ncbi:MAG: HDOD domain-containing protein [Dissulfurispiraceae bacterium]|nr:HDOD domain-containing protein [Dissulfurispiraceae bacterium]
MDNRIVEVKKSIGRMKDIPTLSQVSLRLVRLLNKENASLTELSEIIKFDQSLAERVVGVANSPFFGYPGRINSIEQALLMLGFNLAKSIALGVSIFHSFNVDPKSLRNLWIHSYSVAVMAEMFCKNVPVSNRNVCFLSGLLHDIGRIILLKHYSADKYREIHAQLCCLSGDDLDAAEMQNFGCSHSQTGKWFLEQLSFPDEIVLSVQNHHLLDQDTRHKGIVTLVYLAEGIVSEISPEYCSDSEWTPKHQELFAGLGFEQVHKDEFRSRIEQERGFIESFMS